MKAGIDAHCHLEYMEDREEVAENIRNRMIGAICSVPNPEHFEIAFDMQKKFSDCIYICLGFHPEIHDKFSESQIDECASEIRRNRRHIVGIGEVGLDFKYVGNESDRGRTKKIFEKFIEIARQLKLPLVVHTRNGQNDSSNAIDEALKILDRNGAERVMMHCFSGNEKQMHTALELGYYISFATIIARSEKHQRLVKVCPLDRMLLETDAPWLDPDSRELINRPWKIERSAEIIARLRNSSKEEIMSQTTKNTQELFAI